jgi:hypothetical protein
MKTLDALVESLTEKVKGMVQLIKSANQAINKL